MRFPAWATLSVPVNTASNVDMFPAAAQAFRPPEEAANVLHVGLPTNFKAAAFEDEKHNELLRELEAGIDAVTLDGKDVPVKLKVFNSLFVPLAKWSMLLTGNYRCITPHEPQSIRDAVHGDLKLSQSIYDHVDGIARRLGADPAGPGAV